MPHIPTGFPQLDEAIGIGGVPRGRITTLAGAPTSGKVTLAALVLAKAQTRGRPVAYIDLPHTCDADYLQRCGVRLHDLLVARPQNSRQALDLLMNLAGHSELAAILFDHWGAVDTSGEEHRYAQGALDHLVARLAQSAITLLVLDDPASLWQRLLSSNKSALAHYSALTLSLNRERWFNDGPDIRGYQARVSINKNKFGPAQKTVPIEIHFNGTVRGQGI